MTLHELGKDLRNRRPENWHKHASDQDIALRLLNDYPQYAYLVNESAAQIHKLLQDRWHTPFPNWEKRAAKAENINRIQTTFRASIEGVDVSTYLEMKQKEHQAKVEMKLIQLQAAMDLMNIEHQNNAEIKKLTVTHELEKSTQKHEADLWMDKLEFDADHARYMAEVEAAIERIRGPQQLPVSQSVWQDPGEANDVQDSGKPEPRAVGELRDTEGERKTPRASSRRHSDFVERGGAREPHARNGSAGDGEEQVS